MELLYLVLGMVMGATLGAVVMAALASRGGTNMSDPTHVPKPCQCCDDLPEVRTENTRLAAELAAAREEAADWKRIVDQNLSAYTAALAAGRAQSEGE